MNSMPVERMDPMRPSSLISIVVARPLATLMLTLVIATLGLVSFLRLPVDLLPTFEIRSVSVRASYPGAQASEIETIVLKPLERVLGTVPGVVDMYATAQEGSGSISLEIDEKVDVGATMLEVRAAVDRARAQLPPDLDPPQVSQFNPAQTPILFMAITADKPLNDLAELTRLAQEVVEPRLSRIGGVGAVEVFGGYRRQAQIQLNVDKLADLKITVDEVGSAISAEQDSVAGGLVKKGGLQIGVRTKAGIETLDDLRKLPVAVRDGRGVTLGDVAEIQFGIADIQRTLFVNDKPAIRVGIRKTPGANTVEVAKEVKKAIAELDASVDDISCVITFDQSTFIEKAIDGARIAALAGALLALAVLLFFFHNFRTLLLIGASIPLSVIVSFLAMDFNGSTFNITTLSAISLAVGMLVDDAVVVIDSIIYEVQQGRSSKEAAVIGTEKVMVAIAASTLTKVIIFVPVVFLSGVQRVIYGQMALIVVTSLLASWIVSVTLVPAFASVLLSRISTHILEAGPVMAKTESLYRRLLRTVLGRAGASLVWMIAIVVAAMALWPRVQIELSPQTDEGSLQVNILMPPGTPVEQVEPVAQRLAAIVKQTVPEAVLMTVSAGGSGFGNNRSSEGQIVVNLPPIEERMRTTADAIKAVRAALPPVPDAEIRVRPRSTMFLLSVLRASDGDGRLEVTLLSENIKALRQTAQTLSKELKKIDGVADVTTPELGNVPQLAVEIREADAGALGVHSNTVGRAVESLIAGRRAAALRSDLEEIPIVLRLPPSERSHVDQIGRLLVQTPQGPVALRDIADVKLEDGFSNVERRFGKRILTLGVTVDANAFANVVRDIKGVLASDTIPEGVQGFLGGEAEESEKLAGQVGWLAALTVLLVFMVMAAQFESIALPLLILSSLPFAGVGALLAMGFGWTTLNLYSGIGLLVLVGTVVNNAIVLVDAVRHERMEHLDQAENQHQAARSPQAMLRWLEDSLLHVSPRRLRPILMTTMTTMFGLFPIAMSGAEASELEGPMARVVLAGLTFSTIVTLVAVPALWIFTARLRTRWTLKKSQQK